MSYNDDYSDSWNSQEPGRQWQKSYWDVAREPDVGPEAGGHDQEFWWRLLFFIVVGAVVVGVGLGWVVSGDAFNGDDGGSQYHEYVHRDRQPYIQQDEPSAVCEDGTYSYSTHHQGTCSYHGGVATWLN